METFFLAIVILMLGLAVFDLIVGVSNDAVNFLTSALGAKAATFRTIMIVASIGIIVGSLASGGMMEIAKRGIFTPSLFSIQDLLFIYVVVMLTDVFLLDFFNSVKLPTSTTVSIVFELLGATLAISFLKVWQLDQQVSEWVHYLNATKAISVITAIFVSVGLAFTAGWIVQYVMRALLTFEYKRYMRIVGPIFGAISIVVISNFLLTKGLKKLPIHDSSPVVFINEHALVVFGALFVIAILYYVIRQRDAAFDPFREITIFGTFALAMAFASNDLVNFIGVPVAGLDAFLLWTSKGAGDPSQFMMTAFEGNEVPSSPILLFLAGLIMIITLWRSKKARNVIQTTVNLSRQAEGLERFRGNDLARSVVRFMSFLANGVRAVIPNSILNAIDRRYAIARPGVYDTSKKGPPAAFDMVRASVNLMVAAIVITIGTSYKLPLSTTYVTFMVVMGTSLADRAWNRDSAVYRVSGVLTVIGGWFLTAITAMTLTAVSALIVFQLEFIGVGIVVGLVALGIMAVNKFTDNEVREHLDLELPDDWYEMEPSVVKAALHENVRLISNEYTRDMKILVDAIIDQDAKAIRNLEKRLYRVSEDNAHFRALVTNQLRTVDLKHVSTGKAVMDFFVREGELLRELDEAIGAASTHVLNLHQPLQEGQVVFLRRHVDKVDQYNRLMQEVDPMKAEQMDRLVQSIGRHAHDAVIEHLEGLRSQGYGFKNSQLFLGSFVGHMNAIEIIHRMHKATFVDGSSVSDDE